MANKLIGSVGLAPGTDTGFDLDTKGQLHSYTSTQYALDVGNDSDILVCDSGEASGLKYTANTTSFIIACSDETTALTTGTAKVSFRMPYAFVLTAGEGGMRASCNQAPTGAILTVDVNEAGSTIMDSTKLTIAIGSTTSVGGTAPVITDVNLADNALMTIDIDQIGSSNAGTGLKVTFIGYRVAH